MISIEIQPTEEKMQHQTVEYSLAQRFTDYGKRLLGRGALVLSLITSGSFILSTEEAFSVESGNYPYADAPCYPGSVNTTTGKCNGYDWRVPTKDTSGSITGWPQWTERGFGARNCTDWAAFRVKQLTGNSVPYGAAMGHATTWDTNGKNAGYTVDQTPEPGDIAQNNDSAGGLGHVGVVEEVKKDAQGKITSITISQYNGLGDGKYSAPVYLADTDGTFWFNKTDNLKWDNFIDVNGTGVGVNGTPFEAGVNSYSSIDESTEITDDNWVYTKVGGSAWPIKPKGQWTAADSQYWGNDPQKVSTDDIRSHEVGYDQNGRAIGAHAPKDGTTVYVDQGGASRYYFYEGRAYKLNSEAEMNDLGVASQTQRIPATGDRLNDFLGGTRIILPNGALYRYADNSRIGQIYIQPDGSLKSFYIPNSTMLECIQQTQNRSVKVMPQATQQFVEQGVNVTSEPAGCAFPWHWSLSTPGGEQQFRIDGDGVRTPYTKRYYPNLLGIYLNSEGQPDFRKAASLPSIPLGPDMSSPANIFFRNIANNEVFWQGSDGLAHKVNSMDSLSCMGGPALLPVPPEAFQGGIPLGSPAECSLEGKLVRNTANGSLWYMQNGQRHYVQNMTIAYGLMGRVVTTQGRITDTSDSTVKTYNPGLDAFVPYGPPVFVKYANDSSVWLALPDGTRRHAMSLCGSGPAQWQVLTMPDGEFNGHAIGPNWSANTTDCNKIANGQTIS